MPFLELFDETLDINSTENYELSVQLSPDGFAFSILDTIRNKFVLLRSFDAGDNKYINAERADEIFTQDDFLKRKFRKTWLICPTQKFTMVPSALYDPGKKDEYFSFNHTSQESSIVLVNKVIDPDAFLLFSVSKTVTNLISSHYPEIHPSHHLKPLLSYILHNRKSINGNYIHIHVEYEFFNLIIFNNNLLNFCNSFNYRNISDILFYVLNVFKRLEIGQEETIFFSGITEKYDDLSSTFSMYIRHIKFADPSGNFTFSYVFNDIELHRYLNLFTIVNCE